MKLTSLTQNGKNTFAKAICRIDHWQTNLHLNLSTYIILRIPFLQKWFKHLNKC